MARVLQRTLGPIKELELLKGGAWSTAYGFVRGSERLVVRVGEHVDDYERDRLAGTWASESLPIPRVVEIGIDEELNGGVFAVSQRMSGQRLDALSSARLAATLPSLFATLASVGASHLPGTGFGIWDAPDGKAPHESWGEFLLSVHTRDEVRLRGWRASLNAQVPARTVFDRIQAALEQLIAVCPNHRGVIHGDLLAGNVLVGDDARVSAVLDWGCSMAGDPLYDLALLLFWSEWHRGIDVDAVTREASTRFGDEQLRERLVCYQLNIAMFALQYEAFAGLIDNLRWTTAFAEKLLAESADLLH